MVGIGLGRNDRVVSNDISPIAHLLRRIRRAEAQYLGSSVHGLGKFWNASARRGVELQPVQLLLRDALYYACYPPGLVFLVIEADFDSFSVYIEQAKTHPIQFIHHHGGLTLKVSSRQSIHSTLNLMVVRVLKCHLWRRKLGKYNL